MRIRMRKGRLAGKEVDMATLQAEAAVASGGAEFVDPRPPKPAVPAPSATPAGSWLGPPGELAPPAPTSTLATAPSGSWLGPPGETASAAADSPTNDVVQTSAEPAAAADQALDPMLDPVPEAASAPPATSGVEDLGAASLVTLHGREAIVPPKKRGGAK